MASNDEPWRRKMVVQNIPETWSQDMLENFIEVVTKAELEENGVEHFCGIKHTALMTFLNPLTEQHQQTAERISKERGKNLSYSRLPTAPTAVLIRDIGSNVTSDNLLFYFESSRSGGVEGAVKDCHMYPGMSMAVITFDNPEVTAAVLAVNQHSPSKGIHIIVEPCYEQFHRKILDDLKNQQTVPSDPSNDATERDQGNSQSGASWRGKPSVTVKPTVPPKPRLFNRGQSGSLNPSNKNMSSQLFPDQDIEMQDQDTEMQYDETRNTPPYQQGKRGRRRRRPRFGYHQKRGRGDGQTRGFAARPQEAESFDRGPGHVASQTQSGSHQPVVLNADCSPVCHGWSPEHESVAGTSVQGLEEDYDMEGRIKNVSLEEISMDPDSSQPQLFQQDAAMKSAKSEQHHAAPKTMTHPAMNRWADARDFVPPPQTVPRLQQEKEQETELLKQKTLELERELQKRDQLREQDRLRYEKELYELRSRRRETMQYPAYQLRLMQDFAKECTLCEIIIHEKEGTVEFCGAENDFDTAKCAFMTTLQDSVEDSLDISSTIATILRTQQGQMYLTQVCEAFRNCSFDVQDSRIVCAAFYMNSVQSFLGELKRNIHQGKIKVNKSAVPQLQPLKLQLQDDYPMACITLPSSGSSSEVVIEGISEDFEFVMRELKDHLSRNQPGKGLFQLVGVLETKACQQWCTQQLDDVKALILKNNGDCKPVDGPNQIGFAYHCSKNVEARVQQILDNIHKLTRVSRISLQHELKRYSERALVVNGMNNMGVEPFCRLLEGRLKKDGGWDTIIHFNIPSKYSLPKFEYTQKTRTGARPPRPRPQATPRPHAPPRPQAPARLPWLLAHRHQRRGGGRSIRPFSTNVGSGSLTVKSGDIASENVDGMVCVVGEDMDLKQTAVGQAILKKYPQCAQMVPQGRGQAGRVVPLSMQGNPFRNFLALQASQQQQGVNTLFLVVLTKWPQQQLIAQIKMLVQSCLQLAVQQGNRSVAFPPLGMGKKFQFPLNTVVNAMVTTAYKFLQSNQGSLQSVTFVIYDVGSARQFREAAKEIINPPLPAFMGGGPQQTVDSDSNSDDDYAADDSDGGDFFSNTRDDFGTVDDRLFDPIAIVDDFRHDAFALDDDGDRGGDFFDDRGSDGSDSELTFVQNFDDDDEDSMPVLAAATPAKTSPGGSFEAQVCVRDHQDLKAVKTALLRELRSTFVHEDKLTDIRTFKKLGTRTMDEFKATAMRKCVVLTIQSVGGREMLVVRGQRADVTEMMALIKEKQHAYLQKAESRESSSGGLPSASKRIRLPSYWKICKDKVFKDIEQFIRDHRTFGKLYTMGSEEVNEISALIQKTWVSRLVGAGKDAVNLGHRGIKVVKVERLENPNLWEEYCMHRERLFRRSKQQAFQPLEKVKGSSGPALTTTNISRRSVLSQEIYPQINEVYLFHGTKKDYIQAIHDQGLDTRIASDQAMLGRGVYAAESATKSDQYTDAKTNRTSGNKTMILMRILLGEPYINKSGNPPKFSRPPCKRCYKDRCNCQGSSFFDSVIDDAGRNFREFVVYDRCMCYPEYFITYQRV